MNEQQLWALAKEARQLTDRLGLRLRACPIRPASQYKRLTRVWQKSLAREVRRWRAVNPGDVPQERRDQRRGREL